LASIYDYPEYYEIAFSWRDIPGEVDLFEESFRRFSQIPVKSVLELGSGNSPHMEELLRRGYEYTGLDISDSMLDYAREKLRRRGLVANLVRRNMVDFSLDFKVDFVYIMLGSLFATNTGEISTHFDSVAAALRKGGLYFLDWCVQFVPPWEWRGESTWVMERDGIKVRATYAGKPANLVKQTFEERITLEVDDRGDKITITEKNIGRAIYPQEFLCLISAHKEFEFVGWWNNWNLEKPLEQAMKIERPIVLIRRI
jgi:SAM-dependent methyltransferase